MKLYQREQVYDLDQMAIQQDAQPGLQLMQKAALAVWRAVQERWADLSSILVLAGPGNNGGDAFAVAMLAREAGYKVEIVTVGDLSRQSSESACYRQQWLDAGECISEWSGRFPDCELIIDGLLGIGLNKSLNADWQCMIVAVNEYSAKKVCIDIPSGLNANTGNAMPCAIQAHLTVSFIARKVGCFIADGPDYCGEVVFDDLGLSADASLRVDPVLQVLDESSIRLPEKRKKNSHKNQYGHVLVIGGNRGMSGAPRLAGMAALRSGAGLVSLCVHADSVVPVASAHAELMVSSWDDVAEKMKYASVIVIGPGLGHCEQAAGVLQQLSGFDKPMIIDADALEPVFLSSVKARSVVITPHPGEAARLLNTKTARIQQDRVGSLQRLLDSWPFVCVLKGAGSLCGHKGKLLSLCPRGHSGMATAGTGDVLAGMIGGYVAQGVDPLQATQTAVYIHALAAEDYARDFDENSLIASDIIDRIALISRILKQKLNRN
jgi:NAD(P)H-hydrate epimerase